MSAKVDFTRLWFNDAADEQDGRGFSYAGESYQVSPTMAGGVDSDYASGRSRAWSGPGETTQLRVTLQRLDPLDLAWLTSHRGRVVCVRDPFGRKFFCVYFTTPVTVSTLPVDALARDDSVELTADSVTFSEAA